MMINGGKDFQALWSLLWIIIVVFEFGNSLFTDEWPLGG